MKLKFLIASAFIALSGVCALAMPKNASAAFTSSQCPNGSLFKTKPAEAKPAAEIKTLADCNLPKSSTNYDLMDKSNVIINVIVGTVGVIAVVVIVLGGIFYVTSAGDATKAKRGQNAIIYGVVGLVVAILAYAIVNFVLKNIF